MAAETSHQSPSSSPIVAWDFDVFLSFRGEDTRMGFVSHLYKALVNAQIHTFKDDKELERGEEIGPRLIKAIQGSRISILIFSENYASSSWCLDELVHILDCCSRRNGQTALPIFLDGADPSHVRNQSGRFGEVFRETEERYGVERAKTWRKSLTDASKIAGWDVKQEGNRHESELIHKVVKDVSSKLNKTRLSVGEYLVGMDVHLKKMIGYLDIKSNEVRIVGICGMGGIGKTTIAKAVYNQISNKYEGGSFLSDFREHQGELGLVSLQKQLYLEIVREENSFISSVSRGIPLIQERFRSKKILVILDGVDKDEQVKALAGGRDWFGPGSRIIITSRDKGLLNRLDVQAIYRPKKLDDGQSLKLLCMHAFGRDCPPRDFMKLPKELARAAGGLPLALEILGSSLKNNKIERYWEEALEKLTKFPDDKLKQILQISYDALDQVQKDMFLDIACFFIGMDKQYAIDIFKACDFFPNIGIDPLIDKSLVKMHHNKLIMHDLLRDMGRHIVYEESPKYPGKRSRLWNYKDALEVLNLNSGSEKVECLVLNPEGREIGSKKVDLRAEAFARMPGLRLLQVNDACIKGDFEHLFKKLRWLCWQRCPLKFIPTNFQPVELVILDLSHSPVLTKTPDFAGFPSLGRLILEGCTRLSSVDTSIGDLKKLVFLNLKDCINLVGLPSSICLLGSLEILILSDCSKFSSLPADLGNMESLTELLLDNTAVAQLPDSIGGLRKLSRLSIGKGESESRMLIPSSRSGTPLNLELGSPSVRALQNSVGSLMMLGWSFIRRSRFQRESYDCKITKLPASFSDLRSLQKLNLSNCNLSEDAIPRDFGKLSSLKQLFLGYNNFSSLPNSIANLSQLERLSLDHCTKLQSLPEDFGRLSSLSDLKLSGCKNLSSLPTSISCLSQLKIIYLNDCTKLQSLPEDLRGLSLLEHLYLHGCNNLCSLYESGLSNLVVLELRGCTKLQSLPETLSPLLQSLEMSSCNNLCSLPDSITDVPSLYYLNLSKCTKLQSLPETLSPLLQNLQLSGCNNLCSLPDSITDLPSLYCLNLSKCTKLQSLPQLPHKLATLDVTDCVSLESLPDISNLVTVLFSGCENLAVIENLERLESSSFLSFNMGRCNTTGMPMNLVQGICERSTYVTLPGREVPEWFTHRNCLSCEVPPLDDDRQIQGLIVCFLVKRVVDKKLVPWEDIAMTPAIRVRGIKFERWGSPRYSCPADVVDCIRLFRFSEPDVRLQEGDQIQISATFDSEEFQMTNGGIHFFTYQTQELFHVT